MDKIINRFYYGIDTYSEISINGKKIADTNNMFLRYTYNITDKVIVGENTVSVRILSIREKEKEFPEEGFFGCFNVRKADSGAYTIKGSCEALVNEIV